MESYKANILTLFLNLVLALVFFIVLSFISKTSLLTSFIIISLFFIGWFNSYMKRNTLYSITFDDKNKKMKLKKSFFDTEFKEIYYHELTCEIKDYAIGRNIINNVLFVYKDNENVFLIGESLISGFKTIDILKIKDKITSISVPREIRKPI